MPGTSAVLASSEMQIPFPITIHPEIQIPFPSTIHPEIQIPFPSTIHKPAHMAFLTPEQNAASGMMLEDTEFFLEI